MLDWFYCFSTKHLFGGSKHLLFGKGVQKCLYYGFHFHHPPNWGGPPASATIAMLHGWIILGRHGHTFWSFHGHCFWCFLLGRWRLDVSLARFSRSRQGWQIHKNFTNHLKRDLFQKRKMLMFFCLTIMKGFPHPPQQHKTCLLIKTGKLSFPVFTLKQVELPGPNRKKHVFNHHLTGFKGLHAPMLIKLDHFPPQDRGLKN